MSLSKMTSGSYECVGGPWDGKMIVLHEGDRLRIHFPPPLQGVRALTDEDRAQPIEERVGIYRLYTPKKKHLTYLKWMGEE